MSYYASSLAHTIPSTEASMLGVVEVWEQCMALFSKSLPATIINTWFTPIRPIKLENKMLTIGVPSMYFYEYVEKNYSALFANVLFRVLGNEARLSYIVLIDSTNRNADKGSICLVSDDVRASNSSSTQPSKAVQWNGHYLKKNYTFSNFRVSSSNDVAHALALKVCEKPGVSGLNPLFIYGAPGVGKTHLMNAMGWHILQKNPSTRVLYVSADSFLQQFTAAACNNKTAYFTKFYRQIDVLLIDDIQSFIGKTKTQGAFFQIFNHLFQLGKQIVLTCDKPPIELHGMEERLLSRIAGSCTTNIDRPDEELRRVILQQKMEEEGLSLRPEVAQLIVKNVTSNLRELDGALTSLMLHSVIGKREIDVPFAKEILSRTVQLTKKEISFTSILKQVATTYDLSVDDIRGKSRKQELVEARQIVMYLTKKHTPESYAAIGTMLGNRSHATVVHGCKTIESALSFNNRIKQQVLSIEDSLR